MSLARRTLTTVALAGMALIWGAGSNGDPFLPVGDVGNSADDTGYGAMDYAYRIGVLEVTAGQYRDFLNAVDPDGTNPHGLYTSEMATSPEGCQITWNTVESEYDFSGRPDDTLETDWTNLPVNYVSWYDAARYANWLTTGSTESGVYNTSTWQALDHQTAAATLGLPAAYCIPTEDEWYKAAYYKGGPEAGYWQYPTQNDTPPISEPPPGGPNSANYRDGAGGPYAVGSPYWTSEVGAYTGSPGAYGTFDQGGNVWEWTEPAKGAPPFTRGGSWNAGAPGLASSSRQDPPPSLEDSRVGFRLASSPETGVVPEPISVAFVGSAFLGVVAFRLRRRQKTR